MRLARRQLAQQLALILLITVVAVGYGPCSGKQQPKTVADILTAAGDTKRQLRARNEITAQQDYDISAKLLEANRAYKAFVEDELARIGANTSAPDPSARQAAIRALTSSLRSIQDPAMLGIKSSNAQSLWRESIAGLNTVLTGLEALQGR